jgi:excinuclease UvrABC nuclease subunit
VLVIGDNDPEYPAIPGIDMPSDESQLRQRVAERLRKREVSFDRAMTLMREIQRQMTTVTDHTVEQLRAEIEADEQNMPAK